MAKLYADDTFQAIDDDGRVISGARLFFYVVGTSTKQSTFTDNALSVANSNPVVCDSGGRPPNPVYLSDADYKVGLAAAGVDDPPSTFIRTSPVVHGAEAADPADLNENNVFTKTVTWKHGDDVASAPSLALGHGNIFDITGTTDITSIATKGVGTVIILQFDDVLTLTHNATDLVLPGGTNINTTAGDVLIFEEYSVGDWRLISRESVTSLTTLTKTSNYTVLVADNNKTILADATTVVPWTAGIQEDNSGSSFVDETTDLNDAGANDVALFPAGAGVDDAFYFGLGERFPLITMNVGTVGVGTYTVSWEYWNGAAWVGLSAVVDGTDAFKTTGTNNITFTVPNDWATTTVNAQGPFYYVRVRRDSGTVTTDPLGTQAFAGFAIVLPAASVAGDGFSVAIKKTDASANSVLISPVGSDTIDGQPLVAVNDQHDTASLVGDGSNWHLTHLPIPAEPSKAKAWVSFNGTGTLAIRDSYNVTSVTDNGTGDYTVNWATDFAAANYAVTGFARREAGTGGNVLTQRSGNTYTVGSFQLISIDLGGGLQDSSVVCVAAFGDQG